VYYTQEGCGIANRESSARAVDVVLGLARMPDRVQVDAWVAAMDSVRDRIWPPADYDGSGQG
jgi:hypothetical protein